MSDTHCHITEFLVAHELRNSLFADSLIRLENTVLVDLLLCIGVTLGVPSLIS